MNKEFVPYEQALELNELGYDGQWFGRFYTKPKCKMFGVDEEGRTYPMKNTPKKLYTTGEHCVLNDSNVIIAPLYQQAFRWFREKYGYNCFVVTSIIDGKYFYFREDLNDRREDSEPELTPKFDTYEEAELACLKKLIEIVKNK